MNKTGIKKLEFLKKAVYTISNIPVTPLSLRANAHFGRVFCFIEHIHRVSAKKQAKFGGFSFLEGCYGKV